MNGPADVNDRIHIWLLHHFATREVTTYVDLLRQRNTDWDFQSIPGRVQSGYRHRFRLYLSTWPGLICYGFKQAFRALHADRRKLILVGWSHLTISCEAWSVDLRMVRKPRLRISKPGEVLILESISY